MGGSLQDAARFKQEDEAGHMNRHGEEAGLVIEAPKARMVWVVLVDSIYYREPAHDLGLGPIGAVHELFQRVA